MSTSRASRSFNDTWVTLLREIIEGGTVELNKRTDHAIHVHPDVSTSFAVDLGTTGRLPVVHQRKTFPKTAAAEVAWFLSGAQSVEWLSKYTKIWSKFVEPGTSTIMAAYGYRWRKWFGRDQILEAISTLKLDDTSRRVMVSAWDPAFDGLRANPKKQLNVPCPTNFTLNIVTDREGHRRLHSSLFIRSSDVFVGLPYDVMGHAILMSLFASSLDVNLGRMHVTLAHAHVYGTHLEDARLTLEQPEIIPVIQLPILSIEDVIEDPKSLVESLVRRVAHTTMPSFDPRPEVVV